MSRFRRTPAIAGLETPERVDGLATSSNLFTMLERSRSTAASCCPKMTSPASWLVAILSYGIWQRLFHSDPNIVGRGVTLNTTAYTIAGVLRPGFRLNHEAVTQTVSNTDRSDIFLPLPLGATR